MGRGYKIHQTVSILILQKCSFLLAIYLFWLQERKERKETAVGLSQFKRILFLLGAHCSSALVGKVCV